MDDIIAQARELGKKIAAHPRTAAFLSAARAVGDDREARSLLRAYEEQMDRMHGLEASGRPIEPQDKRKLADLQAQVAGHAKLKAMMKHQADYLEFMNRVNMAIDEALHPSEAASAEDGS